MIRPPSSRVVVCSGPQRWRGRGVCGLSLLLQTPLPPGSHRCPVNWPVARKAEGAHLGQRSGMSPKAESAGDSSPTIVWYACERPVTRSLRQQSAAPATFVGTASWQTDVVWASVRECPLTSRGLTRSAVLPDWVVTSVGCDSGLQGQGCSKDSTGFSALSGHQP